MNKIKLRILTVFFLFPIISFSQISDSLNVDEIINEYISSIAEDADISGLYELFDDLQENKININTANYIELSQLPFLNQAEISQILSYRKRHGNFSNVFELKNSGISNKTYFRLKPFVTTEVNKKKNWNFSSQIRTRLIVNDFPKQNDFYDAGKSYLRLIAKTSNFGLGIVTEKDPFEKNLFDYKTANIYWKNNSCFLRKIILGDFLIEFGQGLVFWSPYSFSKGADIKSSAIKNGRLFTPYKSTDEVRFFRGGMFSLSYSGISFSLFYSRKPYETTIKNNSFYNIGGSGLHVGTSVEQNILRIKTFGGILSYRQETYRISFLYSHHLFSVPFLPNENIFFGNNYSLFSLELGLKKDNLEFFSETAYNNRSVAGIYVLTIKPNKIVTLLTSFRYYPEKYYSLFANGLSEYGKTNNERGFFLGANLHSVFGKFSFYYDLFNTITPNQNLPFPIHGDDFLFQFASKNFNYNIFLLRIKYERKEDYQKLNTEETKKLVNSKALKIRSYILTYLSKKIKIKTQFDYSLFTEIENSDGYALSLNVNYKLPLVSISSLISFFQTKDYNSRIYLYEYDLSGVFKNRMLYGEGLHYYLLAKFKFLNSFYFQIKYSRTFRNKNNFIDIENNNITETISIQAEYRL